VLERPFPVKGADLVVCRFLLTHLSSPAAAIRAWAEMAALGALLVVHETEKLEASDPVLTRYYEMVGQMQRHHGQELNVGTMLDGCFKSSGWSVVHSESVLLEKSAQAMAELHLPNLRTWGKNEFAMQAFDRDEVAALETALGRIASGLQRAEPVRNTARQIVARRDACQ
jgi:trans-aconitate 2-methyltransferase